MFYMTQGKTFTHFYKGTAGNTCSLDAIYVTKAAIKSKINYIQPATVFDSCASWNLQPDIKIIAWMVNHTTLLWKNGAFNGWITAAGYQQSYLIKRNEILQCVKQNVTETSQTNSLLVEKKSVKVSHWKRNEDWQKSSVSSFKVIIGKKGWWLMPRFPMWILFIVGHIFGSFFFSPSAHLLFQDFRGVSQKSGSQL